MIRPKQIPQTDPHFIKKILPYFTLLESYFGYEVIGLENIPARGPGLVVMNHGVIPFHTFILAKQIFVKSGRVARGLGARFLFEIPWVRDFFMKGGAVNASPKNAMALLKEGNLVLLAPGGIYEALITQPGMKKIPWQKRLGFVEIACKMNVPIIPSYCQGINEVYFNSRILLRKRIKLLRKFWFSLPLFFGIGLLPFPVKLIHYIGKPISTRAKRGEDDLTRVKRIHQKVLAAMRELRDQPTKKPS
jgi:1-acyl-sn-glycerol-3-phosphate acyltransferase